MLTVEEVREINLVTNPFKPPISICRVLLMTKTGHASLNGKI